MFSIIAMHNDFLLINKDPDVAFHKTHGQDGIMDTIRRTTGESEFFPVHRLDKMTSGLLLLARNRAAARTFSVMFQQSTMEKWYLALSDKTPHKKQGLVIGDMERSRRGTWKLCRSKVNPAETRFISAFIGNGLRLFLLKPYTGKTHQLRVALKSIGAPALGDPLYHQHPSSTPAADRGYLHAYALRFSWNGKEETYCIPPAQGHFFSGELYEKILQSFTPPWALDWPGRKSAPPRQQPL